MWGQKNIFFPTFLSSSGWANNQITRDRLIGENQILVTCPWGIHIRIHKDSEATCSPGGRGEHLHDRQILASNSGKVGHRR